MLPFATVILLAGWTAIPKDIPEAAEVDGARFLRRLFTIELPMMRPIMLESSSCERPIPTGLPTDALIFAPPTRRSSQLAGPWGKPTGPQRSTR